MLSHFQYQDERELEYEFNSQGIQSLPIPIIIKEPQLCWCSMSMTIFVDHNRTCSQVWSQLIDLLQERVGYLRSGTQKNRRGTKNLISFILDLIMNLDLQDFQDELEILTGCKIVTHEVIARGN